MRDVAAVILAAGKGTRMRSEKAKVLHEVGGVPMLEYPVRLALSLGLGQVVPVIGHQAERVEGALRSSFGDEEMSFALQSEQKGTGHAVKCARDVLHPTIRKVLVLSGDVPLLRVQTIEEMIRRAEQAGAAVALLTFEPEEPHGYGRIVHEENGAPCRIVEEKDCSAEQRRIREVNSGIYLFDRSLLFDALESVNTQNAQGEYYLTDVLRMAHEQGRGTLAIKLADPTEVAGVNSREDLGVCNRRLRERLSRQKVG